MTAMHEEMHQRAGEHENIWQNSENMSGVFGEQIERGSRNGDDECKANRRTPERWQLLVIVVHKGRLISVRLNRKKH